MLRLYTYFRSSAAYRVRIALNLKGLVDDAIPVHLVRDGGEQHKSDYRLKNPLGNVPTLDDAGALLTQSLAIIEYLDECHPQPALLPGDALDRARIRAIAQSIACDIHPLNNLRVLNYLRDKVGADETARNAWYRHWVEQGLAGVEALITRDGHADPYCYGNSPTLADCCLVPQVFNARRFDCDLSPMPTIKRIVESCERLPAFAAAAPLNQADAQ